MHENPIFMAKHTLSNLKNETEYLLNGRIASSNHSNDEHYVFSVTFSIYNDHLQESSSPVPVGTPRWSFIFATKRRKMSAIQA